MFMDETERVEIMDNRTHKSAEDLTGGGLRWQFRVFHKLVSILHNVFFNIINHFTQNSWMKVVSYLGLTYGI